MSEDKAALEHTATARVRYGETDQMGVVYHANYLSFFEIARTELIRLRGVAYSSLEEGGLRLMLPRPRCNTTLRAATTMCSPSPPA